MTEEENPYATPPEPGVAGWGRTGYVVPPVPVPVPGAGARPPDVPARPGMDPWRLRGWGNAGAGRVRLLTWLAVAATLALPLAVTAYAGSRALAHDQRTRYVRATGQVVGEEGSPFYEFRGTAPGLGTVVVPLDPFEDPSVIAGSLLVARGDPTDYVTPDREAQPVAALLGLVLSAGAAGGLWVAALRAHRHRPPGGVEAVRRVAEEAGEQGEPGASRSPGRGRWRVVAAVALAAFGGACAAVTVATAHRLGEKPRSVTVTGMVTRDSEQRLALRYRDLADGGEEQRPLTGTEAARLTVGDTAPVTYRMKAFDVTGADATVGLYPLLGALLAVAGLWWLVRGWYGARAVRHIPPRPVPVLAWARVARGRAWLVVLPSATSRRDRPVVIPLDRDVAVPAAFEGTVHVRGVLRGSRYVLLHDAGGRALPAAGPCRTPFLATVTGVDPQAPFTGRARRAG